MRIVSPLPWKEKKNKLGNLDFFSWQFNICFGGAPKKCIWGEGVNFFSSVKYFFFWGGQTFYLWEGPFFYTIKRQKIKVVQKNVRGRGPTFFVLFCFCRNFFFFLEGREGRGRGKGERGGRANDRPGTDHLTSRPLRGLRKNAPVGTNIRTHTQRRTWPLYEWIGPVGLIQWKRTIGFRKIALKQVYIGTYV